MTLLRHLSLLGLVLALSGLPAGCSDGDGGGGPRYAEPLPESTTTKNGEQAATTTTQHSLELRTVNANPGDEVALGRVTGIYAQLQQVAVAKQVAADTRVDALRQAVLAEQTFPLEEGCYAISDRGSTITYTDCTFGSTGATTSLDGTVSKDGDTLTMDLTIEVVAGVATGGGNTTVTVQEHGSLTFTDTSLTGELHFDVATVSGGVQDAGGRVTTHQTLDADFQEIVLDTESCPIGGSLEVHSVVQVDAGGITLGGSGQGMDLWVKATFGPSCGDVTLF